MIQNLSKSNSAWIFREAVDPEKLQIPDYFSIIIKPMDFGTITKKLKNHEYYKIETFLEDIILVFNNCVRYNGVNSQPGKLCQETHKEFRTLYQQLNIAFYLSDPDYEQQKLLEMF